MTPALITAAGTALVAIIGAAAKAIVDITKAKSQNDAEFQKAILRSQILDIYFEYRDAQSMPDSQYQSCCDMMRIYQNLGGNSYVTEKFEKMQNWNKW